MLKIGKRAIIIPRLGMVKGVEVEEEEEDYLGEKSKASFCLFCLNTK